MSAPVRSNTVHVPILSCPECGTAYVLRVSHSFTDGGFRTEWLYQRDLARDTACRKSHTFPAPAIDFADLRTAPLRGTFTEPPNPGADDGAGG